MPFAELVDFHPARNICNTVQVEQHAFWLLTWKRLKLILVNIYYRPVIILTFCIHSQLQIRSTVSTTNLTDVEAENPKEKKFLPNIEKWQMVILVTVFALIINIVAIYLFGTFFESRYRRGLEKGRILIVTGVMSEG